MTGNSRRACSVLLMSDMKLQNTDTTNRLNTLTQTKNTIHSIRGLSRPWCVNMGTNASRSEEHTSELQTLIRRSYDVSTLNKTKTLCSNPRETHDRQHNKQLHTQ